MTDAPVLEIRDLHVGLHTNRGWIDAVDGVDLTLRRGEIFGLVGESGSGKSMTGAAIAGLLPRSAHVRGSIVVDGRELVGLDRRSYDRLRARTFGMIFQHPMAALDPRLSVGRQIGLALPQETRWSAAGRRRRTLELLSMVGVPGGVQRMESYPHELSGGLAQRVVIAMALARDPQILIADEPTTALDVRVQARILDLLVSLQAELGLSVLLISHDLALVADRSDRVAVMRAGRILETGPAGEVLERPREEYTAELVAASPRLEAALTASAPELVQAPVVEVSGLTKTFRVSMRGQRDRTLTALDGIDLTVHRGEALGIVGESGCGKSTLARVIAGVLDADSGSVTYGGPDPSTFDRRARRRWRRRVQLVFQDQMSSLDPRQSVGATVAEPLQIHRIGSRGERKGIVRRLLQDVGLDPALESRRPTQMSGGQRQRVGIARALALEPEILIADESVSSLDVTTQARILAKLRELKERRELTLIFISHDLAVTAELCSRIVVMRKGRIVEIGASADLLTNPAHPYTQSLLAALPASQRRVLSARTDVDSVPADPGASGMEAPQREE